MILRLGIFISGQGSNMKNIIESIRNGNLNAKVEFVFSNNESAKGLEVAEEWGIKNICLPRFKFDNSDYKTSRDKYEEDLYQLIKDYDVDYICLAGFMHVLGEKFLSYYPKKIINIHPALLPSFRGANGIKDAFTSGIKIAGCTIHFIVPEVDSGEIIAQAAVTLENCNNPGELARKVLIAEHLSYLYALKKLSRENDNKLSELRDEAYKKWILLY